MRAAAPKPTLSTHSYSKLLDFLAFSNDFSFSMFSINIVGCTKNPKCEVGNSVYV